MKKNWIITKRSKLSTICELLCPVILMAVLSLARLAVEITDVDASSWIDSTVIYHPLPSIDYEMLLAQLVSSPESSQELMGNMIGKRDLQGFYNFSESSFFNSPGMTFFPKACMLGDDGLSDARRIIAYTPDNDITRAALRELDKLYQQQYFVSEYLVSNSSIINQGEESSGQNLSEEIRQNRSGSGNSTNSSNGNTTSQTEAPDFDMSQASMLANSSAILKFQYKAFESPEAIVDYIEDPSYMFDESHEGICFGFSITNTSGDDFEIRMFFHDQEVQESQQTIPYQQFAAYSNISTSQDTDSFGMYTYYGYAHLHNILANVILQNVTGNENATIALSMIPFRTGAYKDDQFALVIAALLPFFMLLIYILPISRMLQRIVSEKETKIRESMRMMGLVDWSYWLSWFVYYTIFVTIISVLCLIVLSVNVVTFSNKFLLFLYLWLYGMAQFGFILFMQCFFSSQRFAQIGGTLIYFGSSFVLNAVQDANTDQSAKVWASLLSTVAVSLGANNLGAYEEAGIGINFGNATDIYWNYTFALSLIMMTISFFLFLLVGLYLDNVLPSAFGRKKPWYFCLSPTYWRGHKKARIEHKTIEDNENGNENEFELKYLKKENYEPPAHEMKQLEQDNRNLKIADLMKTFDNGFQAVRGVNVKMYQGQIFALLGHNGAGKTTTISMLTGLITNSSGNAEAFGHDMFEEMDEVRKFMGVCPQHDVLFDLLTPMEHLMIFCDFKGIDPAIKREECKKMIKETNLDFHENVLAKNLSGGTRRKLSVAIALVGGSKLVLLDEPTSGMDLTARRKLWNMLKNQKQDRIVILTTHYMDEADILGDRIGIMAEGRLICLGSSLFLKNRFGVGYNLKMVKTNKTKNNKIAAYLKEKLGNEVSIISEVSSEVTYRIPNKYSEQFQKFFEEFDRIQEQLDIRGYGISITTLEEVFLKVGHGEGLNESPEKMKENKDIEEEAKHVNHEEDYNYCVADDHEVGFFNVFWINLVALFRKRFFQYKRSKRTFIMEVIIPLILVVIGLGFTKITFFYGSPDRELTLLTFPHQRILVNSELVAPTANDVSPQYMIESITDWEEGFTVTYKNYSDVNVSSGTNAILREFDLDIYNMGETPPLEPFRYGSYLIYQADNSSQRYFVSNFVNITSQDVAAFYPQFMYEAAIRAATGNPNFRLKAFTSPHPITQRLKNRQQAGNGMFVSFVLAIGFALIPTSIIGIIIVEKEKNLKHMQMISGMNLAAYWISFYIFDILKSEITMAISIGLFYAFDFGYDNVWILFLLYPVGVLPFTYATSFLFKSEGLAQTTTIFGHFVISGIGSMVVYILRIIESTFSIGDALMYALKVLPSYCLNNALIFASGKGTLQFVRDDVSLEDFDITNMTGDILAVMLHFIFWTIVIFILESLNCRSLRNYTCKKSQIPRPIEDLEQDDDVEEEEARVAKDTSDNIKIRVHKFRKVYTTLFGKPQLAVERSSFGVDQGECFCLIGVNGAGKTTTFKSLTNDIVASSGSIQINGMDVNSQFGKVRGLIGYCPQYDVIFETMTVWEHLDYYSRIKGIRKDLRHKLIEDKIEELNLTDYRDKASGTLSGGNKRKLSVAISLIGNPPIILLDEPSAGMDPQARRFMWTVIAKVSKVQKRSSVVLTTHSMEEVEALSDKLGIFVKGGIFRCFGSAQHIKEKFGTGYEIETKMKRLTDEQLVEMSQEYNLASNLEGKITLSNVADVMRKKQVNEFLIQELKQGGLGNDLFKEAEANQGYVNIRNFLTWLYVENCGQKVIQALLADFRQVELLEHYNDYYKFKIEKKEKSIGYVFGFIEEKKATLNISEYSVSQTTLEQIFQRFANVDIDSIKGMIFEITNDGKIVIKQPESIYRRNSSIRRSVVPADQKELGPPIE